MTAKHEYHCWCDAESLSPYTEDYLRCRNCETLISINRLADPKYEVSNDDTDYYGKHYWFQHQTTDLVLPNIEDRADSDLSGRCLWWLKTVMKYRLPGSTALDVGCSHGAMVFLMEQAGYTSSGLELSRYIVDLARTKFDVPVHCGPVETLPKPASSLDVVCLFDVLEHLADPVATLASCAKLMSADGVFVIQCPKYQPELSHEDLIDSASPFLKMLIPEEHLFLFSVSSAKAIFSSLGFTHFHEEPAYFSEHDMFFVVSRTELKPQSEEAIQAALASVGRANQIQLLLRLFDSNRDTQSTLRTVEDDREARLRSIEELTRGNLELTRGNAELEAAAKERLALVDQLTSEASSLQSALDAVKDDRAQILRDSEKLTGTSARLSEELDTLTAERKEVLRNLDELTSENAALAKKINEIDSDRAKQVALIDDLTSEIETSKTQIEFLTNDRELVLRDTKKAAAHNKALEAKIAAIEADRTQILLDVETLTSDNAALSKQAGEAAKEGRQRLHDLEAIAASNAKLSEEIVDINRDRAERVDLIETLSAQTASLQQEMDEIRVDRQQILRDTAKVSSENAALKEEVETINADRAERLNVIESLAAEVQSLTAALAKAESAKRDLELANSQLQAKLSGEERS